MMRIHKNELPPFARARAEQVCKLMIGHESYESWLRCLTYNSDRKNKNISKKTIKQIEEELFPFIFGEKDNNA